MHNARLLPSLALALVLAAPAGGALAQSVTLTGIGKTMTLTAAELQDMPRTKVDVVIHDKPHTFEGVRLNLLLKEINAPQGEFLRGQALTNAVIVRSRDGYEIVLSLAETDAGMRKAPIILADHMDGKPIDETDGPLRLVVAEDLRPARSARMVETIELKPLGSR